MLTRENLKLLVVAVACLLVAWTGPAVAHGVHAKFAHNADRVDGKHAVGAGAGLTKARGKLVAHNSQGKLPAKFLPGSFVTESEHRARRSIIVTSHGSTAWLPETPNEPFLLRDTEHTQVSSSSRGVLLALSAPAAIGSTRYDLESIEVCYAGSAGGFITETKVSTYGAAETGPRVIEQATDHKSSSIACYSVPVGAPAQRGASIRLRIVGGTTGTVRLLGTRAVWSRNQDSD